ncbi:MAG: hypothetical protein WCA84_12335 [Ignavibacteriaceae bacterium]
MKSALPCSVLFLVLFFFSVLPAGCSYDAGITAPGVDNITGLAKKDAVSFVKINRSADTVIAFPKSGKLLVVNKNYSAAQLSQIDSYLASHILVVQPEVYSGAAARSTNSVRYTDYIWELQNTYQAAPGKYLGIWCDYLTPAQCLNLGFNGLFISGSVQSVNSAFSEAQSAGFIPADLLVSLGSSNSASAAGIISGSPNAGYYFIDEPFETKAFGDSISAVIPYLAGLIKSKNPGGRLLLTSYFLPYTSICNGLSALTGSNGLDSAFESLFGLDSNIYVMCDDYYSNCCAPASGYWDAFRQYYGPRNISNWMSVVINNGSTGYYEGLCSSGTSTNWASLFDRANSYGMNNIWLYAYKTGNDSLVSAFAGVAWSRGFSLRQSYYLGSEWTCSQDSSSFPGKGAWSLTDMYYIRSGLLAY